MEFPELNAVITRLTGIGRGVLAALSVLALVVAGIRYQMAGGDVGSVERAKWTVKGGLVGLAIATFADPIVRVVRQLFSF